jgi:hypothetical protein
VGWECSCKTSRWIRLMRYAAGFLERPRVRPAPLVRGHSDCPVGRSGKLRHDHFAHCRLVEPYGAIVRYCRSIAQPLLVRVGVKLDAFLRRTWCWPILSMQVQQQPGMESSLSPGCCRRWTLFMVIFKLQTNSAWAQPLRSKTSISHGARYGSKQLVRIE